MLRIMSIISIIGLLLLALFIMGTVDYGTTLAQSSGYALRFYGYGYNDLGRVKIPINPDRPADIGGDFTIEFWMKANLADNPTSACNEGTDTWINGNIIIDRDLFGNVSFGDYGISLCGGQIAFGTNNGSSGLTIVGGSNVANGQWRHIAVTRQQSSGQMRIFVDGTQVRSANGPTGNISYNDSRQISNLCNPGGNSPCVNEPFIVIGAEKHDYDPMNYPPYNGFFDELRISNIVRYTGNFTRPSAPFTPDINTVVLYHFDEGTGNSIADSSGNNNTATRNFGGSPNPGPVWVTDTPFSTTSTPTPTPTATNTPPAYTTITISHNELFAKLSAYSGGGLNYLLIGLGTNMLNIYSLWNGQVAITPITVVSTGYIVQFRQGISTLVGGGELSNEHHAILITRIIADLSNAFTDVMNSRYTMPHNVQDISISTSQITVGVSFVP